MQTPDCLLTLVFPRSLEDQIIDFMLTHEAQTSGFISGRLAAMARMRSMPARVKKCAAWRCRCA